MDFISEVNSESSVSIILFVKEVRICIFEWRIYLLIAVYSYLPQLS